MSVEPECGSIDGLEVSMEAKTFKVEFTPEQREELGREAHAAAPRHCPYESLYPAVRDAYCEQGVRVGRLALLMFGREVERPAEGARAPLSYVTSEGLVRVPEDVRVALGVANGGGVTFVEGKDGFFYMLSDAQLLGMVEREGKAIPPVREAELQVEPGQVWESIDHHTRTPLDGPPAGLCEVVGPNDSLESPESWVMRRLTTPEHPRHPGERAGQTLYMHRGARLAGQWVRRFRIAESARVSREPAKKGPPPVPQESRMGEVFAFIQERGEVLRAEIGSHFGLSKGAVDSLCFRLRHAGLIERKRERGQPERAVSGAAVVKASKRPRAQQTEDTVHERLFAFVEERGRVSTTEIQKQLGLTRAHVHTTLHVLRIGKRIAPATGDGFAMSLKFAAAQPKAVWPPKQPQPEVKAPAPVAPPSPPVKAKPAPAAPPVESRVVEVEFITARDSRFKCAPLRCVLTAGSCVDRQAKATGARSGADSKALATRKEANTFAACKSCPMGRRVAQQLAAHVKPTEAQS